MGVWVYGCMGVWVYGCMGMYRYGCMMDVWLGFPPYPNTPGYSQDYPFGDVPGDAKSVHVVATAFKVSGGGMRVGGER